MGGGANRLPKSNAYDHSGRFRDEPPTRHDVIKSTEEEPTLNCVVMQSLLERSEATFQLRAVRRDTDTVFTTIGHGLRCRRPHPRTQQLQLRTTSYTQPPPKQLHIDKLPAIARPYLHSLHLRKGLRINLVALLPGHGVPHSQTATTSSRLEWPRRATPATSDHVAITHLIWNDVSRTLRVPAPL